MPHTLAFDLTFPYPAAASKTSVRRLRLPVRVLNPDDRTRYLDMDMLIDSGADTTCLPLAVALAIGVDLTTMIPIATEGVGGSQQAQLCPTGALLVCGVLIDPCPILFLQGLPELLYGSSARVRRALVRF